MERYSLEKAQEEAALIQENIKSGRTRNYAEAENSIEEKEFAEKWQKGGRVFDFILAEVENSGILNPDSKNFEPFGFSPNELGPMAGVLLGEKAVALGGFNEKLLNTLEEKGYNAIRRGRGSIIYDPIQVEDIAKKYPEYFQNIGASGEEITRRVFADTYSDFKEGGKEEYSIQKGLLLGYPLNSILDYVKVRNFEVQDVVKKLHNILPEQEKTYLENTFYSEPVNQNTIQFLLDQFKKHSEELNIKTEDLNIVIEQLKFMSLNHTVDIHGIIWTEFQETPEARSRKEELERAFEVSGIAKKLEDFYK